MCGGGGGEGGGVVQLSNKAGGTGAHPNLGQLCSMVGINQELNMCPTLGICEISNALAIHGLVFSSSSCNFRSIAVFLIFYLEHLTCALTGIVWLFTRCYVHGRAASMRAL